MSTDGPARQPHAVLDLPSRRLKAIKIERLLDLRSVPKPLRILEIGTGSGGIAHYFANYSPLNCDVTAVDISDQRLVRDGYEFKLVKDTALPFAAASFDVVITNHVIEHVGGAPAQRAHLTEVRRVLEPGGVGYLAVPNRWMLVEPHYRLAFLSWLPRRLRSPYLRLMGRGSHYDCEPLTLSTLESLLSEVGFNYRNLGTRALRETLALEGHLGLAARIVARFPDPIIDRLAPIIPTLIYALSPAR
jgi:SAM-dependent methyltransferase